MYRIVKTGTGFYAIEIESVIDDVDNIGVFVEQGEPVIIVNSISDLSSDLNIYDEVQIVEREEEE